MEVHVLKAREEMGKQAGMAVENKIIELLRQKDELRMIFAAAPSQNEFLAYLSESANIPWNRITAFQMDEYIGLSPQAPQLFSNFLKAHLFDKVDFKAVHILNGNTDPAEECSRYAALLSSGPIDIVCMGIGENGHIAFNDPPVADFHDPETVKEVILDYDCRQQQVNDGCFDSLKEVPEQAITLTIPTLLKGEYIYCIVPGVNKHKAVLKALGNSISTACPASILKAHDSCEMFLDEESFGQPANYFSLKQVEGINCTSGKLESFSIKNGRIDQAIAIKENNKQLPYIGPGLVDLQVNGVNGIDFNDTSLTETQVEAAAAFLLTTGVTTFFPTVITNSDENILTLLKTINRACKGDDLTATCIGGIHLEGPFLSTKDGARGAHNKKYIKAPDWDLFEQFQKASGNRIKLVTLAPELENSINFIKKCRKNGVLVSIGHSFATSEQIAEAVEAGATLSTHLGNAVPLMLPRHPNLIWDQLAQDSLYASIIADGFHLPDSFLKVVIKTKGDRSLLVSDGTCFTGMAPGTYQTHIGEEVKLDHEGRLALNDGSGLLAGATKTLLADIQNLMDRKIAPLNIAWKMGSVNPAEFLGSKRQLQSGDSCDMVVFTLESGKIAIQKVFKNGRLVYKKKDVMEEVLDQCSKMAD